MYVLGIPTYLFFKFLPAYVMEKETENGKIVF